MKKSTVLHIIFFITGLLIFISCSSKPKNPGDIVEIRILAEKELTVGNREAGRGNFEMAHAVIKESQRKSIIVDDVSLMIRTGLSLGNVLLSIGSDEEAFKEWERAIVLSQEINNRELLAVSRIYLARGRLVAGTASAQSVLDEVNREAANIKTDNLFVAFTWQVKGLAQRDLRLYREAEDSVKRSLDIHEKERYLENASYDWYLIASIRSLSGNTNGALQALETSLALDRRIENTWGLAATWRAIGDVHMKAGKVIEAMEAYRRAKAIFLAMGNETEAAVIDQRITD
jgi:tetratricopeptide (TPR) repeat protein